MFSRPNFMNLFVRCVLLGCAIPSLRAADEVVQVRQIQGRPAEVMVVSQEDPVVIRVKSPSGIGMCELERSGDTWPSPVVLQLHLKGLEGLHVTSGEETLQVSVSSSQGGKVLHELVHNGTHTVLEKESPYWSAPQKKGNQAHAPGQGGYFEYRVPAHLLRTNPKQLRIRWIDFYRG